MGHLLGAIAGYAALTAAGGGAWVAALAAGLTMALTTIARTLQAAGCATARRDRPPGAPAAPLRVVDIHKIHSRARRLGAGAGGAEACPAGGLGT
ncbi:hypothetical protein [Streptomyces sp. NBC_00048]|uniref:hypothetical protein n=1 Tax=Streptomyces sp. NBC_00048 TaxID=2975628 RepID=UPI00386A3D25